ncbi:MAG: hypothetical protein LBG28_03880 [Tannerella sp.]|nr:hypothetical protein [Tannerella sp.]
MQYNCPVCFVKQTFLNLYNRNLSYQFCHGEEDAMARSSLKR